MAAIYTVYTSPNHPPVPNHLPTLIVTPHGQPTNILYSYLHTNFNTENYLLTPSPQGDLCVAKLFPPRNTPNGKSTASDPGHSSSSRVVRCEASRNLKWSIANTGVLSPIYKLSLPSPDSPDLPLFQISKPNPNAAFWSMFYFAYAGHNIPPKRIEFGKIQKNTASPNGSEGGGTRISITGKSPEEKAVWQTLGEGNEDCVEWVVLCAALNLLDDEIIKAAEKNPPLSSGPVPNGGVPAQGSGPGARPAPVSLRDPGPMLQGQPRTNGVQSPQQMPPPGQRPPQGYPSPEGHANRGPIPPHQMSPLGQRPPQGYPPPEGYAGQPHRGPIPPQQMPPPGQRPPQGYPPRGYPGGPPPGQLPPGQQRPSPHIQTGHPQQPSNGISQARRF